MKKEKTKKGLLSNLVTVFLITVIAKATGFGREMVYSSQLGITDVSDSFIMAQTIPFTLYEIVTQAFRTTYIPNLFKIKREKDDEAVEAYTGNYIIVITIVSIFFFLLLFIFAGPLTRLFAGGFTVEKIEYTVYMTRFTAITIIFSGLIEILNGYLQSNSYYQIGSSLTIFSNVVFCGFIFLYSKMGIAALLYGIIAAKLVEFVIIFSNVVFHKLRIRFNDWRYFGYTVDALRDSIPVLFGSMVSDVGSLIDRRFASVLPNGTVSGLNYANKVEIMISQLFLAAIGSVLFSELSKKSENINEYKTMIEKGIRYIITIMTPIMIGTIVISQNIISVLFERGAFNNSAVILTSQCLVFYSPAIMLSVIYGFLSKASFAIHDTKSPVIASSIGMIVNVIFNALLVHKFQHRGLAFSTSLSVFISLLGVFISLGNKIGIKTHSVFRAMWKVITAIVVMVSTLIVIEYAHINNKYLLFFTSILISGFAYFITLYILKCKEVIEIKQKVTSKFLK